MQKTIASILNDLSTFSGGLSLPVRALLDTAAALIAVGISVELRTSLPFGVPVERAAITPNWQDLFILAALWFTAGIMIHSFWRGRANRDNLRLAILTLLGVVGVIAYYALTSQIISRLLLAYYMFAYLLTALVLRGFSKFLITSINPGLRTFTPRALALLQRVLQLRTIRIGKLQIALPLLAAFFAGLAWLGYTLMMGVSFSPDSVRIMISALRYHAGETAGLRVVWPPLFPLLIHLALYLEPWPADAMAWIVAGSLLVSALLLARTLQDTRGIVWLSALLIVYLFTLERFTYVFRFGWSESVFVLATISTMHFVWRHEQRGQLNNYLGLCASVAAMTLSRYAGLAAGLPLLIYAWQSYRAREIEYREWKRYLALTLLTFLPVALYMLRNWLTAGTLMGNRRPNDIPLLDNFLEGIQIAVNDLGIPFIFLIFFLAIITVRKMTPQQWKPIRYTRVLIFYVIFSSTYFALIVFTTAKTAIDHINSRFLAPIYPVLILIAVLMFYMQQSRKEAAQRTKLLSILAPLVMLLAIYMNAEYVNQLARDYSASLQQPSHHRYAGFNLSSTSEEFGDYLTAQLKESREIYIWTLHDRDLMNRAFFFRRSTFGMSNPINLSYSFEGAEPIRLAVQLEGRARVIQIVDLGNVQNINEVATRIDQFLESHAGSIFIAIISDQWIYRNQEELSSIDVLQEALIGARITRIDPYVAVEFTER